MNTMKNYSGTHNPINEKSEVSVPLIKSLLKSVETLHTSALEIAIDAGVIEAIASTSKYIEPYFIIDLVQKKLGVSVTRKDRKKETIEARQVAIYLLKKYCRLSLMRISQYVALSDHSGVLHHLKTIEGYIQTDDRIAVLIESFEKDILEYFEKKNNDGNGI